MRKLAANIDCLLVGFVDRSQYNPLPDTDHNNEAQE